MKKIIFIFLFLLFSMGYKAEASRIVSLAPNTTEILFVLGLGDSVVGVDEYSNYPEEAKEINRIGTFAHPNIEKIVLLRPDYVLISADLTKDRSDYLEALGMEIIKVSPDDIEGLCNSIKEIGRLFHREEKAGLIVKDIKERIESLSIKEKSRPKVFIELSSDPLITVSSFIGDAIKAAGGDNVAWDVSDNAGLFSIESLIYRNPDVLIVIGFSDTSILPESIKAIKNGRVYKDLDPDLLLRPGPRIIEAIEELNKIFYEKK
ncbi:ABC transporter substrate-binding protein [Candidatus Omnitrophota bacterium]